MHARLSERVRAPALSLYYQQPSGCTVCCGLVATGNGSMITRRAQGVLKLRSEPLPHEREAQQWAAAAVCNSRPAQLSVSYLLEKLHCVHIVCAGCVMGRATLQEFMLDYMK